MRYFPSFIIMLCADVIVASLHENITTLSFIDDNLLIIKKETFENYPQLEEINIINSEVNSIDDGTFYDLPQLRSVNLSKNFISHLGPKIFQPHNRLWKFVLSHNNLNEIDDFDISYFPKLKLFDISHNRIKALPLNLLDKLRNDANFTLIATNNPWDCRSSNWSSSCDKTEDVEKLPRPLPLKVPPQASFITCIFYTVGAFWIGVILGNVCLIKRILFKKIKSTKRDQGTQYEAPLRYYEKIHSLGVAKNYRNPSPSETPSVTIYV